MKGCDDLKGLFLLFLEVLWKLCGLLFSFAAADLSLVLVLVRIQLWFFWILLWSASKTGLVYAEVYVFVFP